MPVSSWWSHAVKCVRERLARDAHRAYACDALCGPTGHNDGRKADVIRLRPESFRRQTGIHNRK